MCRSNLSFTATIYGFTITIDHQVAWQSSSNNPSWSLMQCNEAYIPACSSVTAVWWLTCEATLNLYAVNHEAACKLPRKTRRRLAQACTFQGHRCRSTLLPCCISLQCVYVHALDHCVCVIGGVQMWYYTTLVFRVGFLYSSRYMQKYGYILVLCYKHYNLDVTKKSTFSYELLCIWQLYTLNVIMHNSLIF